MLKVKRLSSKATLPRRMRDGDAGFDLYSVETVFIEPGEIVTIPTGIAVELPPNTCMILKDRSGLALKGLHILAGVIDENYRGEIKVVMVNLSKNRITLSRGTRVTQALILPYLSPEIVEVDTLSDTERGDKGFGSSGLF